MDKKDVLHMYSGILLSHKKNEIMSFCSNMDGPTEIRERQISYDITFAECKKNDTNELIYKTKQSHGYRRQTYGYGLGGQLDIYTLLYIKQINKDLLYSIGNTDHYSLMTYTGKESKKEWIYVLVRWHHQIKGHEQTPGDSEGQGSLVCYSPWGRKKPDTTQ